MKIIKAAIIGTGYGLRVQKGVINNLNNIILEKIYSRKKRGNLFTSKISNLVNNNLLDMIYIETPPNTHLKYLKLFKTKDALLLCEKPLVSKKKELEYLIKNEKHFKNKVFINHQLRHHPNLILFKKEIKKFGKILSIQIKYFSNNFREKKNDWWLSNIAGGGHLMAIGPHLLDLLVFFNGNIDIIKIKKKFSKKFKKKIDTSFEVNGLYKNKSEFKLISSCIAKNKNTKFQIKVKTESNIIYFDNFNQIKIKKINGSLHYKYFPILPLAKKTFFLNHWRIAQYYFIKKIVKNYSYKKINTNFLLAVSSLKLLLN
tara:strand:- start:598 stop:1542 length:945 start_codon:yes stop_codon:yes gene_type:complete